MNFAHEHFHSRLGEHGHFGRALVETVAEVCRNHPAIIGVVTGVAVEQLLAHEKQHHDQVVAREAAVGDPDGAPAPAPPPRTIIARPAPSGTPHHMIRLANIKPGRIALEVFGGLVLLKFSSTIARFFKRDHADPWFAPAARIHLFSGTFAAYYIAKALKARKVSSWRNAAAALFATDAIKPLLKPRRV